MHYAKHSGTYEWLQRSENRSVIIRTLAQPMTAIQLVKKLNLKAHTCMSTLRELERHGLLACLNQDARQNRIYWLSKIGLRLQRELRKETGLGELEHFVPDVNWDLYGQVCFGHRAAIISVLGEPMQAAKLRRKACSQNPRLRMSANNARDALRFFSEKGIVERIHVRKKVHPHFVLTKHCLPFQKLLQQAVW